MADREDILGAIPAPTGARLPDVPAFAVIEVERGREWERLREVLPPLGARVVELSDLCQLAERTVYVDQDAVDAVQACALNVADDPWEAEVGITWADGIIVETGTLVISAGPYRRRLASLTPPLHVALVPADRVWLTLEEALSQVTDRTTVFVTGSSRTADIEGVLVRGVHGPGEVWVVPMPTPTVGGSA